MIKVLLYIIDYDKRFVDLWPYISRNISRHPVTCQIMGHTKAPHRSISMIKTSDWRRVVEEVEVCLLHLDWAQRVRDEEGQDGH